MRILTESFKCILRIYVYGETEECRIARIETQHWNPTLAS